MVDIIKKRSWTEQELCAQGFYFYPRKKQIVMARQLPATEAPLTIKTKWENLVAVTGYMICYDPGLTIQRTLTDYEHWPVHPDHFARNYQDWDEPGLSPTAKHLMLLGCKPYYKFRGAWAKRLTAPTHIQSMESSRHALIPPGAWLLLELSGEAWHVADDEFRNRYEINAVQKCS